VQTASFAAMWRKALRAKRKLEVGFREPLFFLSDKLAQMPSRHLPLSFGEVKESKIPSECELSYISIFKKNKNQKICSTKQINL
jgi:hypothetical protein